MNIQQWTKAVTALDCNIHSKVQEWEWFLPKKVKSLPSFGKFQEHMMHVIMSFLSEKNDGDQPQELFIQVPLEELANRSNNSDALQDETFKKTVGTVASCIVLSTIEELWRNISIGQDIVNCCKAGKQYLVHHQERGYILLMCVSSGKWPRTRDQFYQSSNPPRFYGEFPTFNNGTMVLYYIQRSRYDGRRRPCSVDQKFIAACDKVYEINETIRPSLSDIKNHLDILERIRKTAASVLQYHSASLVSIGQYRPQNERIPIDSRYFDILSFENNINNIQRRSNTEVLIAVGDKVYKDLRQAYRARGFKKIIYIGTNSPDNDIPKYPFTYREMYRYCAPSKKLLSFFDPRLIQVNEFPWMEERLCELRDFIGSLSERDESISEATEDIIACFRSIFSNINFNKELWDIKKGNIRDLLNNILPVDCSLETLNSLVEWINQIDYDEDSNPKNDEARSINDAIIIGRNDSYKNKIKSLENHNNKIVIDSASYSPHPRNAQFNAFQYILSHHLFARIFAIYYRHEERYMQRLLWFLNQDNRYYVDPLRQKYLTAIEVVEDEQISDGYAVSLDDIQLDEDWNAEFESWWSSNNSNTIITFIDGSESSPDGEVLIAKSKDDNCERKYVTELDITEDVGSTMYYYQNPERFEEYKDAILSQTEIDRFSNMWKEALRNYFNQESIKGISEEDTLRDIKDRLSIKKRIIKRYLKEDCTNKFFRSPRNMKVICDFLVSLGMLSETDAIYIRKAQKRHSHSSQFGKDLKNEILSHKQCLDESHEIMDTISKKLSLSLDEISESCLRSGVIKKIKTITT